MWPVQGIRRTHNFQALHGWHVFVFVFFFGGGVEEKIHLPGFFGCSQPGRKGGQSAKSGVLKRLQTLVHHWSTLKKIRRTVGGGLKEMLTSDKSGGPC